MRLIAPTLMFAAAAFVASCGGSKKSDPLGPEQQLARLQGCMNRMEHYQQLGLWKHGGARPGIDRAAWDLLGEVERTEVFDIAGCIKAGGQIGEQIVTVAEEGNGRDIATRGVANVRDFTANCTSAD